MLPPPPPPARPTISDAAVQKATGKTWDEWFHLLDVAGAKQLTHKEIVPLVRKEGASKWWEQMVTVAYEQARGLRQKHQKPTGFEISVSRTLPVPLTTLYAAWTVATRRRQWLPESFTICKAAPGKSLRITWLDRTHVDVTFSANKNRSQIVVGHRKLPHARAAARQKRFWTERLRALREMLKGF